MQRKNLGQFIEHSTRDRHIKIAWLAGVLAGIASLLTILLNTDRLALPLGIMLLEPMIYLALSYGIYRRRFSAAVGMVLFFALGRYVGATHQGIAWTVLLGYFFIRGARELWLLRRAELQPASGAA